jgi:hypothetical protein
LRRLLQEGIRKNSKQYLQKKRITFGKKIGKKQKLHMGGYMEKGKNTLKLEIIF